MGNDLPKSHPKKPQSVGTNSDYSSNDNQSQLPADANTSTNNTIAMTDAQITPSTSSFSILSKPNSSGNGIAGKYVSHRLSRIVCTFWNENIETLSMSDQLEISCSMFFSMLLSSDEMKQVMKQSFKSNLKIKTISLKYLNMMGWLIRNLQNDGINLYLSLTKLGALHTKVGIKHNHFIPMLQSLHEIMSHYFPNEYTIGVQYAMEAVMVTAAEIMTGKDINRTNVICGSDTYFLQSLETCLSSSLGLEYFNRYLRMRQNEEITIYLQLMQKFKRQTNNSERYTVAKEIIRKCIDTNGSFAVNISYECREQTLKNMEKSEKFCKNNVVIAANFFEKVEIEMRRLIIKNHWRGFVKSIVPLRNSMKLNLSGVNVDI